MPKGLDDERKGIERESSEGGLLEDAVKKAKLRRQMMDAIGRGDFEAAERFRKRLQGEK